MPTVISLKSHIDPKSKAASLKSLAKYDQTILLYVFTTRSMPDKYLGFTKYLFAMKHFIFDT